MADVDRIEQLKLALAEEKRESEAFFSNAAALSKNEQRKQGLLLFPLRVASVDSSTSTSVTFHTTFPINDSWFRKGAAVTLRADGKGVSGKITELQAMSISVIINDDVDLDFYAQPELAYREDDRTMHCMELGLRFATEKESVRKLREQLNEAYPEIIVSSAVDNLNAAQNKAFHQIISDKPTVLIQGPPGTGKTNVLSQAIQALVKSGKKVILSAPSNTAVDNLALKLIDHATLLRLGNDEKIDPRLHSYTLEGHLEKSMHANVLKNLEKQLRKAGETANRHIRNFTREAADEKRAARAEVHALRREMRQLRETFRSAILDQADVIAGTPVGLFNQLPSNFTSDVVIVDEAGQATEPLIWLIAVFAPRLVLAGDPQQLPPTIMSQKAARMGLATSLLEWSMRDNPALLLDEQYRMSEAVVNAINESFYYNQLRTGRDTSPGELVFVDTAGFGTGELRDEQTGSISNHDEAKVVRSLLTEQKLPAESTVILSPYSAQLGELQTLLPEWKVSTIDSIQGQEAENIVISLVRSNEDGEIGFLRDYRRMNVAISRARERCLIVGDSATIGGDVFYAALLERIEEAGGYRSAWELEV